MKITIGQEIQVCFAEGWFIGELKDCDDELNSLTLGGAIPLYDRNIHEGKIPDKTGEPIYIWIYSRTDFKAPPEKWSRTDNKSLPVVVRKP